MKIYKFILVVWAFCWAGAAFGQTSPDTFLEELKAFYAKAGGVLEIGSQSKDGDTLTLENLSFKIDRPEMQGSTSWDSLVIRPSTDAQSELEMVFSDSMQVEMIDLANPAVGPMTMTISFPGNLTRIGGTPDNRIWTTTADAMSVAISELKFPDDGGSAVVNLSLSELSGTSTIAGDNLTYSATAKSLGIDVDVTNPDGTAKLTGNYSGISVYGAGAISSLANAEVAMSGAGIFEFVVSRESGTGEMNFAMNGTNGLIKSSGGTASLSAKMGDGQLDYSISAADLAYDISADTIPFPDAGFKISNLALRFAFPIMPAENASEATILVKLEKFSAADSLWQIIDPVASLSREPATLIFDVSGQAKALFNLLEASTIEAADPQVPMQFESVKINAIQLSAVGAEITATGEATISNDGPVPVPTGGIDVNIVGVIGLIDQLAAMGLLPAEQAMGPKMMIGMFAKPSDAPDSFTSHIEMDASGAITANGIPLE